ncbi:creatininase family protein [Nonomuraea lactucae]|uniref:creatininase family protein n=1 Tax=Nonomuraea lactucae TaxID=2249762 RepID=UPI000DE21F03|nr:creatininase family protein [Nonomuraea lactucae]
MAEILWNRMTYLELRERAAADAVVLLPVGSTEQHGPHLPTGVDDFLAGEVCRRAALLALGTRPVVVAPSIWCGLAEHHMGFGGTFTLTLPTLHALLHDVCRSIIRAGFSKILIVNGHGGNVTALNALVTELSAQLSAHSPDHSSTDSPATSTGDSTGNSSARIAVTSYFTAGRDAIRDALDTQDWLMHACEGETSMIMELGRELVRRGELADAVGPRIMLQSEDTSPAYVSVPFDAVSESGVAGDARTASAAKGRSILDGCARAIADLVAGDALWRRPEHRGPASR